jgi:acetoacetyl-CoA reductase/3-oxoacyl-[acyl-carrier protein] reductase
MATLQARESASQVAGEKLKGRVALVTGGTRGIGAAIGRSLAAQQATVAAGYSRDEEKARSFMLELEELGVDASIHRGNVASAEDCQRTVQEVIDRHGRVDILINNAGITADKSILKMAQDDWYKVLAVNLSGAFFMSQAALQPMLERGTGRIVNISSIVGQIGNIGQSNYAASKSGMFGLTMSLAREAASNLQRSGRPIPTASASPSTRSPRALSRPRCSRRFRRRCLTRSAPRSRSAASAGRRRSPASCTSSARTHPPSSPARCGRSTAARRCDPGRRGVGRRRRSPLGYRTWWPLASTPYQVPPEALTPM